MIATPSGRARSWRDWVGLAARLILGGTLVVAGALKIPAIAESIQAVRSYLLLPYELTTPIGIALPFLELAIGLALLAGLFTRASAASGALLMAVFIGAIASVWARGISIDCGCFGGGGVVSREEALASYPWDILRDLGLVACGLWLTVRPRTPFAADNVLAASPLEVDPAVATDDLARPSV